MEVEKLIEDCKNNVRKSQRTLFEYFYSDMSRIVMRYCPNVDDAKEVLNDGFLTVFSKIHSFKGESTFKTWMTTVFIRHAIKKIKQNKAIPTEFEISVNDEFENEIIVYENALAMLELKELIKIIDGLPKFERIVFNLFVFEGFKHKEIAEICEFSEGTSRWYLNNAKRNIKEKYNQLNYISKT